MNDTQSLPLNAARDGGVLLASWSAMFCDQFWPSDDSHTSTVLVLLLAMNDTQSWPPYADSDGADWLDSCSAVFVVQFVPSAEEQTSTVFVLLLAINDTHNRPLNTASDGAAWLDSCSAVFVVQLVPSAEEQTSTVLVLLFAMNDTHSRPLNTASEGANLLDSCKAVLVVQFVPSAEEQTSTVFVLLLATNAPQPPHSSVPPATSSGNSTVLVLLLATNATKASVERRQRRRELARLSYPDVGRKGLPLAGEGHYSREHISRVDAHQWAVKRRTARTVHEPARYRPGVTPTRRRRSPLQHRLEDEVGVLNPVEQVDELTGLCRRPGRHSPSRLERRDGSARTVVPRSVCDPSAS